jgi:hypothetical protein
MDFGGFLLWTGDRSVLTAGVRRRGCANGDDGLPR